MNDLRQELESIVERLDDNDADIRELVNFRSTIIGKISSTEYVLRETQDEIFNLEDDIEAYKECKDGSVPKPEGNLDDLHKQENDYENKLEDLKSLKNEIDGYLSQYKVVDKNNCFTNIRYLMPKRDIKIGQIEKKAGVGKGYMSRLEKPDNVTDPSLQFVATAARMLNVSIDELLFGHPTNMSEAEVYIYEFLRDLLEDTRTQDIIWSKEQDNILDRSHDKTKRNIVPYHEEEEGDGVLDYGIFHRANDDSTFRYHSTFFPDLRVKIIGTLLTAKMPDMSNTVFLVPRSVEVDDGGDRFFEVYITDDDNQVIGLCNTRKAHPSIISVFNELYKAAIASSESVHIDDNTKNIINRYKENRIKKGE